MRDMAQQSFEALPETRTLLVPVGGGGLISGISIATHGLRDDAVVYGAQSDASPTLHEARISPRGNACTSPRPDQKRLAQASTRKEISSTTARHPLEDSWAGSASQVEPRVSGQRSERLVLK